MSWTMACGCGHTGLTVTLIGLDKQEYHFCGRCERPITPIPPEAGIDLQEHQEWVSTPLPGFLLAYQSEEPVGVD